MIFYGTEPSINPESFRFVLQTPEVVNGDTVYGSKRSYVKEQIKIHAQLI